MSFWKKLLGGKRSPDPAPVRAPREAPPDPKLVFRIEAERFLRDQPSVAEVATLEEDFAFDVTLEDGRVLRSFLGNAFHEWRHCEPEARAQVFERFFGAVLADGAGDEAWDDVRDRLRPLLRPVTFGQPAQGKPLVTLPGLPFLMRTVGVDYPGRMRYVTEDDSARWGKTPEEIFAAAVEAFAPHGNVPVEQYDPGEKIWIVHGDSYASSRLLLPGWLSRVSAIVDGRPIAAIPERDMLIFAGDARADIVRRMAATARAEHDAAARSISPALYTTRDDGEVVPYVATGEASLVHEVATGHLLLRATEYHAQKLVLERQHQRDGVDVFVASCTIVSHKTRGPFSYCTWFEGIASLLPETDVVVVGGGDGETKWMFGVAFTDLTERAAAWLERAASLDPTRWSTKGWPDESVLRALYAARTDHIVGQPPPFA